MRMSDLLGSTVRDVAGRPLGHVHDVRLVQNGPILGSWGAALTVDALLIGPKAVGARLGYGRSEVQGPWAVRVTFEAIHGLLDAIPWRSIVAIQPGTILVREEVHAGDGPRDGRLLDAGLELLDRQILDPDGRMAGNVDDLTLSWREGAAPPFVSEILAGPGALSRRLGGRLGRWIAAIHGRLQDQHLEGPASMGFGIVSTLDEAVHVTVGYEDLPTFSVESWVRKRIVGRIPGA
jgi:sporulation protein YlmC with PRC-barrel domain